MYKVYLTHFMCADDYIYTFRNCWNALKAQWSACFFFSAHKHRNIGIIGMLIWTWIIKKHLRNVLGSYGSNTKQLSASIEKRVSQNQKEVYLFFLTAFAENQWY